MPIVRQASKQASKQASQPTNQPTKTFVIKQEICPEPGLKPLWLRFKTPLVRLLSDGHCQCLFCLGEGYIPDRCSNCSSFSKRTQKVRVACLSHFLLLHLTRAYSEHERKDPANPEQTLLASAPVSCSSIPSSRAHSSLKRLNSLTIESSRAIKTSSVYSCLPFSQKLSAQNISSIYLKGHCLKHFLIPL